MALVEPALAGMVVLVACPYLAQAAAGALGAILVTAGPVETDLALAVTHPEALGRQVLAERVAEELAAGLWTTALTGGGLVAGLAAGSAFLAKEVMVVAASGHSPKALMAVLALGGQVVYTVVALAPAPQLDTTHITPALMQAPPPAAVPFASSGPATCASSPRHEPQTNKE